MVEDAYELSNIILSDFPKKPLFLLGHSMGSFLARSLIVDHSDLFDGVIIMGTGSSQGLLGKVGKMIARSHVSKHGSKYPDALLDKMSFGSYNKKIPNAQTPFDWLSRDKEQVAAYIEDPLCGFVCTSKFFEDLLDGEALREKLEYNLDEKNTYLTKIFGEEPLPFSEVYEAAVKWGKALAPYVEDASRVIDEAIREGKGVLFEGAQGTLLDIDHGTYPFVTSSSPVAAGGCVGLGTGPGVVDRVIGVVKAYCTRVGEGPFPTEDTGEAGVALREKGGEYGATTGRPRRCGWLDLVALRYAVRVNGLSSIALTKLDVLTGMGSIPVCTGYEIDGRHEEHFPSGAYRQGRAKPVYERLEAWSEDISSCREFEQLPLQARKYVEYIEEASGIQVNLIGVGPGRDQTILRNF
ncbi:MAG: hypothetical protein EOM17_03305 [Synergistales bacterium]|nr:hypothetical protein [Synergistales bacterium]